MRHIYTIYDPEDKAYFGSEGYYGNESNVKGFATREAAKKHIEMYYRSWKLLVKRVRVKA